MTTLINDEIWEEMEDLTPEQKLAILWLKTNSKRNLTGATKVSARRFEFETGIKFEVLQGACKGIPRHYEEACEGLFWDVNSTSQNCGKGEKLIRSNISKSIVKQLLNMEDEFIIKYLKVYKEVAENSPELREKIEKNKRGLEAPPKGEKVKGKRYTRGLQGGVEGLRRGCEGETDIDKAIKKINGLKDSWSRTPHLSSLERHDLAENMQTLKTLGDKDFQNLREWVNDERENNKFLISSRSRFIQHLPECVIKSTERAEKTKDVNDLGKRGYKELSLNDIK